MKKYLRNVANPADITGTSKKWAFEFSAKETVEYRKEVEIIATDDNDADDIAERMCDNGEIDFAECDEYDTEGFDEIECENMGEVD